MTDLRKAAERLLEALDDGWIQRDDWVAITLRQALAQPEQETVCDKDPYLCGFVRCQLGKVCKNTAPPSKPEKEKESALRDADPRLLLGRSNNFTKETGNRLCDIERRLAVIETQQAPPSKEWVSLTEKERRTFASWLDDKTDDEVFNAIEAALRSKNDPAAN